MPRRDLRPTMLPWLVTLLSLSTSTALHAEPVSFRHEVMAVLSRAGCNMGACHGNQNGKNGFKLSLRGEDPIFDLDALTRDTLGRRVNRHQPESSLILAKATAVVPHEGGKRFAIGSVEYDIVRRWIAEGVRADPPDAPRLLRIEVTPRERVLVEPEQEVPLRVRAVFVPLAASREVSCDVTRLAVFETSNLVAEVGGDGIARRRGMGEVAILVRYLNRQATVRLAFVPARPNFLWRDVPEANFVDRHIFAKLKTLRTLPSDVCSDTVFLRRAYLDTLGLLPTASEACDFLADTRAHKRAALVDRLLERPEFADFWALKWSDLLRNEEKVLDHKGVQLFHDWIRRSIAEGKPLNEFARELIVARGSTYSTPAANYYRALRDPHARAEATAQVFLGIRLQCAKCHNHPFERWTQHDYHSFAAFFARVQYRIVENNRRDRLDKHEFDGEQVVWLDREGELVHPRTQEMLKPRFLGSTTGERAESDRLAALADWVARPDNPFFARAQVNRVWFHLMGRGLVEPNDDFRESNPAVNEPLLDALSKDFSSHRFDLRHLVRTIMSSRSYQLSAAPNDTNRDEEANFARALIRPLQAEQLLDAVAQVTGVPVQFPGQPAGVRAGQLPGVGSARERNQRATDSEMFLSVFGKPVRSLSCECERSDDTTLNQAFQLITGEMLSKMLSAHDNRIGRLLASGKPADAIVDELYLSALSRPPSEREKAEALKRIARAVDRRQALEDLTWCLLNAKEFLLRQ